MIHVITNDYYLKERGENVKGTKKRGQGILQDFWRQISCPRILNQPTLVMRGPDPDIRFTSKVMKVDRPVKPDDDDLRKRDEGVAQILYACLISSPAKPATHA